MKQEAVGQQTRACELGERALPAHPGFPLVRE